MREVAEREGVRIRLGNLFCPTHGKSSRAAPATQAFVREFAKWLHLWLDATEVKTEALWLRIDGTEKKYKDWAQWQPDNLHGRENYLDMVNGQWNDNVQISPLNVGFICEWKYI